MSQELVLGKYEFYPYEFDENREVPSLEELVELLRKAKAKTGKDVETSSRSLNRRRPRRKTTGLRAARRGKPRERGY